MKILTENFCRFWTAMLIVMGLSVANATQAPNPRAATTAAATARNNAANITSRQNSNNHNSTVSRSATSAGRATTRVSARNNAVTGAVVGRSAARRSVISNPATMSRSATNSVARSATTAAAGISRSAVAAHSAGTARSAKSPTYSMPRSALARATAVFSDVSKIGGGYAQCRESYATCMDQFCAMANDTYRRCYCSSKFTQFRETEAALDAAKDMLVSFENNNLNAVDKSAAEVNAMYTATEGEQAIKNDVSGAAQMLAEIGDLLSGKKKAPTNKNSVQPSGLMDIDFSVSMDDIWSGGGNSLFDSGSGGGTDMSQLEGLELYNTANKQCLDIVSESCQNEAVLNMAKSAYNIIIAQDCNAYEKKINAQRETVEQTVRTAEKYLREARLEDYRSHNSADVNECIDKVRNAITADGACGSNYIHCLDYTGAYINQTTGEPIYSPRLFELKNLTNLGGVDTNADVLQQNPKFNEFLESRKMFANSALDSCRGIADTVWNEFKRVALIEIAQAQDAKLEEVKMECVNTMKECYDTQSGALKNMDTTTAKVSGALSVYAAKTMCQDQVSACAALYSRGTPCKFNSDGSIGNPQDCGVAALVAFIDTVDETRVAEGCGTAIETYLKDVCKDTADGKHGYPWGCRKTPVGNMPSDSADTINGDTLANMIAKYATENCYDPSKNPNKQWSQLDPRVRAQANEIFNDVRAELESQMAQVCAENNGAWLSDASYTNRSVQNRFEPLNLFYDAVFGDRSEQTVNNYLSSGICAQNNVKLQCEKHNTNEKQVAKYNAAKDECEFTNDWFEDRCSDLGGYYDKSEHICYMEYTLDTEDK